MSFSHFYHIKKIKKPILFIWFISRLHSFFYSSGASQLLLLDFLTVKFSTSRTLLSQVTRIFTILILIHLIQWLPVPPAFQRRQPSWLSLQLRRWRRPRLLTKPHRVLFSYKISIKTSVKFWVFSLLILCTGSASARNCFFFPLTMCHQKWYNLIL